MFNAPPGWACLCGDVVGVASHCGLNATKHRDCDWNDEDEFVLMFKRGDKFMIPHETNNDNMIGNGDYCHVRMTVD